jgi:cell division septum initiation protein DivIVA
MKGGCGQDSCGLTQSGGNFFRSGERRVQRTQKLLRKSATKSQLLIKKAATKSQNLLRKGSQKSQRIIKTATNKTQRVVRKATQKTKRFIRKGAYYTISKLGKIIKKAKKILRKTKGGACGCNKQ